MQYKRYFKSKKFTRSRVEIKKKSVFKRFLMTPEGR